MHSSPYLSIKALYSSFDNEGTMSHSTLWDLNLNVNVNVNEPITLSFSKLSCCFVPCLLHWSFVCFKVRNVGNQRGWNALFGARTWEGHMGTMTRENQQLVTDEPVGVQDCRKITNSFRGIYRIYPNLIKENRRMSRCNQLCPKISPITVWEGDIVDFVDFIRICEAYNCPLNYKGVTSPTHRLLLPSMVYVMNFSKRPVYE